MPEKKLQWISTAKELPGNREECLIYIPDGGKMGPVDIAYLEGDGFARRWCCPHDSWIMDEITHWMPLPKPPEEAL